MLDNPVTSWLVIIFLAWILLRAVRYFGHIIGGKSRRSSISANSDDGKRISFKPDIPSGFCVFVGKFGDDMPYVAGTKHRKKDALKFAKSSGQSLLFEREPGNPADKNAIKVIGCCGSHRYHVGYVPAQLAEQIIDTGVFDHVQPRLKSIWIGDDHISIEYQIIGEKAAKERFLDF